MGSPWEGIRCRYYSVRSDRYARSQLDHALWHQIEIFGGRRSVPLHPTEELAPPGEQPRLARTGDRRPAEEKGGLHGLEAQPVALEEPEAVLHVGLLHEPVGEQGLVEPPALDHAQFGALRVGDAWHVRVDDGEE